jgi:ribonuclease HI
LFGTAFLSTDGITLMSEERTGFQLIYILEDKITVLEIKKALRQLTALKYVTIQWVPSHVGIHGHENADLLAKKGTTLYKSNLTLEAHEAKTTIKNEILKKCQTQNDNQN